MIAEKTPAFWRATLALCCGSFMVFHNLYLTQPLLPELQQVFAITTLQANASLAIATLTLGLSLIFYGSWSDVIGRRALMLFTLLGALIVTCCLALVQSFSSLLILRALQGFLLGGLPAIALAYMGDEFNKNALLLAVGIYIGANSLGGISGRLVSGWLADLYDWRASFIAAAILSAGCLIVFWWNLPASNNFQPQAAHWKSRLSDLWHHLKNPLLRSVYLIGGLNFFIFLNQYSYATYLLAAEPWNLNSSLLGMLFLTYLSGTWGASISGRVALKIAQPLCMALGILMLILGSCLMLLPSLWAIIGGLLINSFGFFFCHSNAASWVSRQATKARASANSLYLVFYYLGASTGSFYLDPFWRLWQWPGVILASLLVFSCTLGLSLQLARRTTSA